VAAALAVAAAGFHF